jgi:hypothetical protein
MRRRLPLLAGSVILTACNSGKITVIDKISDGDLVSFCETQIKCVSKILHDYYLFTCVDNIRDQQHQAVSLGCEAEYIDLFECSKKEATTAECRSDFDSAEDWSDHLEDLYEDYYDNTNPCEDEVEDYSDCIDDFMGVDNSDNSSSNDTGYNGYYE